MKKDWINNAAMLVAVPITMLLALLLAALLMVMLALPGGANVFARKQPQNILTFPDTEWNMTQEQVKEALSIPEDRCVVLKNYMFSVTDYEILGMETTVTFHFTDYTKNGQPGLDCVYVLFPGGTDPAAIQAAIAEELGEPGGGSDFRYYWGGQKIGSRYLESNASWLEEKKPVLYGCLKNGSAAWLYLYETGYKNAANDFPANSMKDNENPPIVIFSGSRVTELLQYIEYGYPEPETTETGD